MIRVELEHATAVFTTRTGGVSAAPFDSLNVGTYTQDDPAAVARNIEIVRDTLGVDRLLMLHQVHGGEIRKAGEVAGDRTVEGDGLTTETPNDALLITGADCPTVVLAAPGQLVALHCGWRPLAAGIIERAVGLLRGAAIEAAVGPGIGAGVYEVGSEVPAALGPDGEEAFTGRHLSLRDVIVRKLERAGATRIEVIDRCTFSEPGEFFSHRRDGAQTGRQAGIAWLR